MASSSFLRNTFVLILLAVTLPSAYASFYPPVCFTKTQKCCFKFFACGTIIKKVPFKVDCSFKKCFIVCKPFCFFRKKKVPFKVCKVKKVRHGVICKKVKVYHNHTWIWKKICKPKFVFKRICVTKFKFIKEKICKKKCRKVCKLIPATCIKIKVLSFPKFCPKLSCDKFIFKGDSKAPGHKVGKKSTLVKVIKGKRTIKH